MKKILFFLLINSFYYGAPLKILFIGNSLTYYNNMPEMFSSLCSEAKDDVIVERWTSAGTPLRYFSRDEQTFDKIRTDKWDYVILQSDDITAFDDMYHIEMDAIQRLKDVIKTNCASTKIIYEMIWGLKDGVTVSGEGYYSYLDYINKIYNGTLYIADEMDLIIAPVGWAWKSVINQNPNIELFSGDKAHPSLKGSYLAACVFYSTIFNESVENNNYHNTLVSSEASFFQKVASETVLNNTDLWYPTTDLETQEIPRESLLLNNYPNPFNPSTTISFSVPQGDDRYVELKIYNTLGVLVDEVINSYYPSGTYSVQWHPDQLASGIYVGILKVGSRFITHKMNLVK